MPALKFESFGTKRFDVIVNNLGHFWLTETDSGLNEYFQIDAMDQYKAFKRVWRKSKPEFDKMCRDHLPLPIIAYIEGHSR